MAEEESINQNISGSLVVEGNLGVEGLTTTNGIKVVKDDGSILFRTNGDTISFKTSCTFQKPIQIGDNTIIGKETTYNSSYVGTDTLQAGERLVLGDSAAKWDVDSRKIIADTFDLYISKVIAGQIETSKKLKSNLIQAEDLQVTNDLIGQNVYADTLKVNKLFMDTLSSLNLNVSRSLTVKDIIVSGSEKIQNSLTINGIGVNGAALTVNGGEIVANWGIVSHTRNNRFQCMEIMGSGKNHDICFTVDSQVDSLFQGDVTIQDSNLILDNSKFVSDNILVTSLSQTNTEGVEITTKKDWEEYKEDMVENADDSSSTSSSSDYDPYEVVQNAIQRNASNYQSAEMTVKRLVNPISYIQESANDIPRKFNVKKGIFRTDSQGNTLKKNLIAENGTFSKISAYEFDVNRLNIDKVITTAIASNVVDTDNLLKSRGIAEFDGSVHSSADIFIESDSNVNVADGAKVTFASGSELKIEDGATLNVGENSSINLNGSAEIDISKVTLVDSSTGIRCKLTLRRAIGTEGCGVILEYTPISDNSESSSSRTAANISSLDARELNNKLKELGI